MIRFCMALASVAFLPVLPSLTWLLVTAILIVLCAFVKRLQTLLPILLGLAWGLVSSHWMLSHRLPDSWQGVDLIAQGTIVGLPQRQQGRCRFDLALDQLINPATSDVPTVLADQSVFSTLTLAPRRLRLNWYRCQHDLQPGQRWQFQVRLKRPHGFVNQTGFDYSLYLLSRGIDATGYVRATAEMSRLNTQLPDAFMVGRLDRWRSQLVDLIQHRLSASDSSTASALLAALLVGDKSGLDAASWQTLRDTGTAHLFVISGLHIGMVAGFSYGLVFWLGRLRPHWRYRYRQIAAAWCAITGAGIYAGLAGFGLPTQRAWVMVCALMLSLIGWRSMTPCQRLWLAAAAVLVIEPLAVRQAGFWLSFGACAVLLYAFAGRISRVRPVWQLLWAQLAIMVGLTPWLLLLFSQWPPLAPVINVLAIPLVTLLLPVLLLGALLLLWWPMAAGELLSLAGQLLQWGWQLLEWSAQLVAPWTIAAPVSWWALLLALIGAAWVLLPRAVPGRWLGAVLWMPLLWPASTQPDYGAYRATVLDVGQGLSVLVETQNHRLLFDSGPRYRSGFNAAEAAIIPFMHSQGIRQLDRLIISHADSDHSGGQRQIEQQLTVVQTLSGSPKIGADSLCHAGQQWRWDGVEFRVLYPPGPISRSSSINENNRSCVLLVDGGAGQRMLLTGDIEARVERLLVQRYGDQLRARTLVAAHHGSRSSTTALFLQQVDPERVLISSGWRNRFGHPHPEVVQRINNIRNAGRSPRLFNTAIDGAIRLQVDGQGSTAVTTSIASKWGFWRVPLLDRGV